MTYKNEFPVHDTTFVILARKRHTVEIVKESDPDDSNPGLSVYWRYLRDGKVNASLSWSGTPAIYDKLIKAARDSLKRDISGTLRAKLKFERPQLVLGCCAGGPVSEAFRL